VTIIDFAHWTEYTDFIAILGREGSFSAQQRDFITRLTTAA
jgi:hypothetical protein